MEATDKTFIELFREKQAIRRKTIIAWEAKRDSLLKWGLFSAYPHLSCTDGLPEAVRELSKYDTMSCPLCTYFFDKNPDKDGDGYCGECPLAIPSNPYYCCMNNESLFQLWNEAEDEDDRELYASMIFDKIAAWDTADYP